MPLTRSPSHETLLAATSVPVGTAQLSSAFAVGYGYTALVTVTNGATGPTAPIVAQVQVSADGVAWHATEMFRSGPLGAGAVNVLQFDLGPGGLGGDWAWARLRFVGHAGQAVTVAAVGSGTLSL